VKKIKAFVDKASDLHRVQADGSQGHGVFYHGLTPMKNDLLQRTRDCLDDREGNDSADGSEKGYVRPQITLQGYVRSSTRGLDGCTTEAMNRPRPAASDGTTTDPTESVNAEATTEPLAS
jgi:hypothetical protein